PLASMYQASFGGRDFKASKADGLRRAIELTNALLAGRHAVEVNVVAERLVLVRPDLLPLLLVLRRRGKPAPDLPLSQNAARILDYLISHGTTTAGEARAHLNAKGLPRPDPADLALAELQYHLLIDRGSS